MPVHWSFPKRFCRRFNKKYYLQILYLVFVVVVSVVEIVIVAFDIVVAGAVVEGKCSSQIEFFKRHDKQQLQNVTKQ